MSVDVLAEALARVGGATTAATAPAAKKRPPVDIAKGLEQVDLVGSSGQSCQLKEVAWPPQGLANFLDEVTHKTPHFYPYIDLAKKATPYWANTAAPSRFDDEAEKEGEKKTPGDAGAKQKERMAFSLWVAAYQVRVCVLFVSCVPLVHFMSGIYAGSS